MSEVTLSATCYYPLLVNALRPKQKELKETFSVATETGRVVCKVSSEQASAARIEATALLDLSAIGEDMGRLGCAYWSGTWKSRWWAPYGVGHKGNALVPGRDFAHGGATAAVYPFGTRIEFRGDIPEKLEGLIRPVMYRGDKFGDAKGASDPRRVDLYTTEPCNYFDPIKVQVTKPWRGSKTHPISSLPTKGFQQASRILGLKDKNGNLLSVDDDFGSLTESVCHKFLAEFDGLFHWGVPKYINTRPRPWDSEIYFLIRETAKEKVG